MTWYNSVPSNQVLDNWIKFKYNVLFHGRHGVGKTSMIFDAFNRVGWELGRDFLYFSAATIDPWVDLIGVPARVKNEDGEEVLKLIRPESIHNKTIKAFFVDELNRSHKKVRNALMELIQFKSINGLKFPNLDIVWAAVNPDEDDVLKFDVEKLDPAQEDRFQIQVQIPYEPSEAYFSKKFNNPEMGLQLI
jgi:alkaline phosphatase D